MNWLRGLVVTSLFVNLPSLGWAQSGPSPNHEFDYSKVTWVSKSKQYKVEQIIGGRREIEIVGFSPMNDSILAYRIHSIFQLKVLTSEGNRVDQGNEDSLLRFDVMSLLVVENVVSQKIVETSQWEWKFPNVGNPLWYVPWEDAKPKSQTLAWVKSQNWVLPLCRDTVHINSKRLSIQFGGDTSGIFGGALKHEWAGDYRLGSVAGGPLRFGFIEGFDWSAEHWKEKGRGKGPNSLFKPKIFLEVQGKAPRLLTTLKIKVPKGPKLDYSRLWRVYWHPNGHRVVLVDAEKYRTPSAPLFEDFPIVPEPLFNVVVERLLVFDLNP